MFKTRLITALILLPAFLLLLFGLDAAQFSLLFAVLLLIGGWEYSRLCGFQSFPARLAYMAALVAGILFLASNDSKIPLANLINGPSLNPDHLLFFLIAWLLAFTRLIKWQPPLNPNNPNTIYRSISTVFSLVLLLGAWYSITSLRILDQGQWWVLTMFMLVWAADVGAYLAGKQFGKRRLAAKISPGKTYAGLVGGVLISLITIWAFVSLSPLNINSMLLFLASISIIILISVGGDLYVSLHKRSVDIKDSGQLFPGHGGILDRLDSTIAAAPFFLALLLWLVASHGA